MEEHCVMMMKKKMKADSFHSLPFGTLAAGSSEAEP